MVTPTHRIATRIRQALEDQERSLAWLTRKTGIPRSTLVRRLSGRADFMLSELLTISEALDIDPLSLIQLATPDDTSAREIAAA